MPVIKISLSDSSYQQLAEMAKEEGVSVQDVIRNKVFGEQLPQFTPAEAVERALKQYEVGDRFTIPELYGDEWAEMKRGVAGVFGKQFYHFVSDHCLETIRFVGMTNRGRHAQYEIVSK
jgi:hypothetical protein